MSANTTPSRAKVYTTKVLGNAWVVLDDGQTELSRANRVPLAKDPDHARRLVACWNACDSISTERLEQLTVAPNAASKGKDGGEWTRS